MALLPVMGRFTCRILFFVCFFLYLKNGSAFFHEIEQLWIAIPLFKIGLVLFDSVVGALFLLPFGACDLFPQLT